MSVGVLMSLGQFVHRRRLQLGYTQEEVVQRMGLGHPGTWLSRLERDPNRRLPEPDELAALARVLEVRVADLVRAFGYVDPEEPEPDTAPDFGFQDLPATPDEWEVVRRAIREHRRRSGRE